MRIGIVICDRYKSCAGGKCLKAMRQREGAFSSYSNSEQLEIVGFTSCGGCPGGNVEYAPGEMIRNGVEVIHFATGFVVGYPPCPYIKYLKRFIEEAYKIPVVIGTHPIPQKYLEVHDAIGTWQTDHWQETIKPIMADEAIRRAYD